MTKKLYWTHGYGGGGPVTKGVIQTNRRAAYIDADIIATGHIHERWILETIRLSATNSGNIQQKPQFHIQLPTYKEEFSDGFDGYHIEKGRPPKPIGAIWLKFTFSRKYRDIMIDPLFAR